MSRTVRRAPWREPLVHFVIAGGVLFGLDRLGAARRGANEPAPVAVAPTASGRPAGSASPLVVDGALRRGLAAVFEQSEGRPPTEADLARVVDDWVEEETLFREGVARGLERDDPKIRQRVASRMMAVLGASVVVPEPTEAQLVAHHAAHRDRWDSPALVDFTHVFVEGHGPDAKKRAAGLLASLEQGADTGGMGDVFSGGHRYRRRSLADLAEAFGDPFARGLDRATIAQWKLRESRFGFHLVRVDRVTAAETRPLAEVRDDVAGDWQSEQRRAALDVAVRELRARHPVETRP